MDAIKYVDEIIPYDTEQSLLDLLEATKPIHLRFIGEDWANKEFTGKDFMKSTTLVENIPFQLLTSKKSDIPKMNPFDFVTAITFTKKDIMVDDVSRKSYSPFLPTKVLVIIKTAFYGNEMNSKSHLDSTLQFHYFLNTLRKRKRFSKWSKPRVLEDMKVIAKYYDCSMTKAEEYHKVLSAKEIKIMKRMKKGGRQ